MSNSDLWYVKLPSGDVHRVTVDQLDEAFQRGQIDGRTLVMGANTERWMTLAEILGDDGSESPAARPAPAPVYRYVPHTPYSLRPMSVDFEDVDVVVAPPRRNGSATRAFAAFAITAAFAVVAVVRPDLRASAVARVQATVRTLSAARTQTVTATAPDPVAVTQPPAASSPVPPLTLAAAPPSAPVAAPLPSTAPRHDGDSAQVSRPTPQTNQSKPQPQHAKVPRKASPPSRAKSAVAWPKRDSRVFTTGGNKFDPLNSSI
ncbi:MAG: hypothetical protein ACRENE_14325 [Polyangiaceae bacterium]